MEIQIIEIAPIDIIFTSYLILARQDLGDSVGRGRLPLRDRLEMSKGLDLICQRQEPGLCVVD